jgi:cytochrome c biogenesis protein CcmG, thiol:disulfide interchange protein DsbE
MSNHTVKTLRNLKIAALTLSLIGLSCTQAHAAEVGSTAPTYSLPTAAGKVDSASLKGKLVYVDFWASWCVPCKQSFPWMNEMQAKYGNRGLHVLAINVDGKQADADKFLALVPAKFQVAFDPAGVTPKQFAVKAMPTSYLIDGDGRVVYVHAGFRESDQKSIEAAIVAALDTMKKR